MVGVQHPSLKHVWPEPQVWPQLPQLLTVVSAVQTPLQHASPDAQTLPQVPQLAGSVWTFVQLPEQLLWPEAQCVVQVPFEHTSVLPHAWPHVPQLS